MCLSHARYNNCKINSFVEAIFWKKKKNQRRNTDYFPHAFNYAFLVNLSLIVDLRTVCSDIIIKKLLKREKDFANLPLLFISLCRGMNTTGGNSLSKLSLLLFLLLSWTHRSIQFVFDRPFRRSSLQSLTFPFLFFLQEIESFPGYRTSILKFRFILPLLRSSSRLIRREKPKWEPNERKPKLRWMNSWRVWWWSIYWCTSNDVGRLIRANTWPAVSTYQLLTITFVLFICEKMDWLRHA